MWCLWLWLLLAVCGRSLWLWNEVCASFCFQIRVSGYPICPIDNAVECPIYDAMKMPLFTDSKRLPFLARFVLVCSASFFLQKKKQKQNTPRNTTQHSTFLLFFTFFSTKKERTMIAAGALVVAALLAVAGTSVGAPTPMETMRLHRAPAEFVLKHFSFSDCGWFGDVTRRIPAQLYLVVSTQASSSLFVSTPSSSPALVAGSFW